MSRELIKEICIEKGEDLPYKMKLSYYMLTDRVREEYCDLKVYGAEIEKTGFMDDGKIIHEKKVIKNLFFKRCEAEDFMSKLINGVVTPVGLKYAVQEHIGEQIRLLSANG